MHVGIWPIPPSNIVVYDNLTLIIKKFKVLLFEPTMIFVIRMPVAMARSLIKVVILVFVLTKVRK